MHILIFLVDTIGGYYCTKEIIRKFPCYANVIVVYNGKHLLLQSTDSTQVLVLHERLRRMVSLQAINE